MSESPKSILFILKELFLHLTSIIILQPLFKVTSMFNISHDFNVQLVHEEQEQKLYIGIRALHYHLLLHTMVSPGKYSMVQSHIHRYELAHALSDYTLNLHHRITPPKEYVLSNGTSILVSLVNNAPLVEVKVKENDSFMPFSGKDAEVQEILTNDLNLLNTFRTSSIKEEGFRNKIMETLLNSTAAVEENVAQKITDQDLEIIAFEMALLRNNGGLFNEAGLYDIFKIQLNHKFEPSEDFKEALFELLTYSVSTETCDCGSPGCFFDTFKPCEMKYFNVPGLLQEDGTLNAEKATQRFSEVWKEFSDQQKSLLLFLDEQFGNTPLLNMAFFDAGFSLDHYIYCMCFPYQPDSDDEQNIRLVSSIANYYIKMHTA